MVDNDEMLWVEKFRPRTIEDCILPEKMKESFSGMLQSGVITNMIFKGTAGVGKTTVARALCEQLDTDYIMLNGSGEFNMETLRTTITDFVTSVSISGKRKVIIVDESDGLPPKTQDALRSFMEAHSKNCAWIFTCNLANKIITPKIGRAHV